MMPPPLPDDVFATLPPAVQAYIRTLEALASHVVALTAHVSELEANHQSTTAGTRSNARTAGR